MFNVVPFFSGSLNGTTAAIDSSAQAWANQVVTNGGTVSAPRLALVSAFIAGAKTDVFWPRIDVLWFLAAENTQSALLSWANPTQSYALASNSGAHGTFLTDRGYTGDGIGGMTTTYNFSSSSTNFTQNLASIAAYCNLDNSDAQHACMGIGGANTVSLWTNNFNLISTSINNSSPINLSSVAASTGLTTATRSNSTTLKGYRGSTLINTDTSTTSAAPTSGTAILLGNVSFNINRFAMFCIGGLLDSDIANWNNRVTTYLTAIGAN